MAIRALGAIVAGPSGARARMLARMWRMLGGATAGVVAVTATACSKGYTVVEPTPTPAKCAGNPPQLDAIAQVLMSADGQPEISLLLERPADQSIRYLDRAPVTRGAEVVFWQVVTNGLELRLRAPTGTLTTEVPMGCSDGDAGVSITIVVPPDAKAGQTLEVKVSALD